MNRISSFYKRKNEHERLNGPVGQLEFLRTKQLIAQYLSNRSGLEIADIGGGTGPYSFWLAELGHNVQLFDLVELHIEQVNTINQSAKFPLRNFELADVRNLQLESETFDLILLMGPLYHLTNRDDRIEVLKKTKNWIKPGGRVIVAYISRFASAMDGFIRGLFADPEFADIVKQDLKSGIHTPNKENTRYFTDSYFHHPDEMEDEVSTAGLTVIDHVAVEGIGWLWQNFAELWSDQRQRQIMLDTIEITAREKTLLGASAHIAVVAEK